MASQLALVLLGRHLALKEPLPFVLVVDSLQQSATYLLAEFAHALACSTTYLSFETTTKPHYAAHFVDCAGALLASIAKQVAELDLPAASAASPRKRLLIIDSLNYIPAEQLPQFVSLLALPALTIVACFHSNAPQPLSLGYPDALTLLHYIAQSVFEVSPVLADSDDDARLARFHLAVLGYNLPKFRLHLVSRRKLGKALTNDYIVDTSAHHYEVYKVEKEDLEEEEMLKDLTTFNLTTSSKQKLAREQVELPFMEAQTELGKYSGAIVYEFEKDDDYDEEDPYEDPF